MEWTKESMIEVLTEKARESVKNGINEIDTIGQNPNKQKITHIINAEYHLAQYHAYMNLLEELDMNKFVELADETETARDQILEFVDQLYK